MSPPPHSETQGIEVRGYTSHNTLALPPLRALSHLIDFSLVLLAVLITADYFRISPMPKLSLLLLSGTLASAYWFPQKKFFGLTLGERAWLLKSKKTRLYQRDYLGPLAVFGASLITTLSLLITAHEFRSVVLGHPNWLASEEWKLQSFSPNSKNWTVSPFYYLLGGWPKSFQGKPVFYSLPYEVGPPNHFVGHVTVYWEHPNISVTLEGPKTPERGATAAELRNCFLGSVTSNHCLLLRETALTRHVQEITSTRHDTRRHWSMKWFHVENPLLSAQDAPQGIYLSARDRNSTQDRFIFINVNGTHQAIILRRPNNERGEMAFALLQNSIGSIRNSSELESGKAWINQTLEATQLKDLKTAPDNATVSARIGEIQQLLISKITVDPADFNSYFHLAGTSLMLAKTSPEHRLRIKLALDNLASAQHYARDVAPEDSRLVQIQNLDTEIHKFLGHE